MNAVTASTTNLVRFLLDGKEVNVAGQPATLTVLEYLREVAGCSGTKEGCAEGDCGACTVVLGELGDDQTQIRYRAINSCIRFLPTIDGKALFTVQGLMHGEQLHPVQQALVEHHASQCGFCTPGFAMSLFALYQQTSAPQRDQVIEALSGNLCRCTGYRPIIDAGCRMHLLPEPGHLSRTDAQSPERHAALRALQRSQALQLPDFYAPRSVDALAEALQRAPHSLLLAGGTDIGLWVTKHLRDLPPIIYLGEVAELQTVEHSAAGVRIGAAVSLSDAWPALLQQHPMLAEQAQRFASPPVRNSGTLCGNLANGSPIGDGIPALIALQAQLQLRLGKHSRSLPLEQLYLGYQKKALAPGEFVASVLVPPPASDCRYASYKVAKRIDQDISAVSAGFAVTVVDNVIVAARLAYGGMAATARRATQMEQALLNQPWSHATIEHACAALARDFQPLSDMRASDAYRLQVAGNLLRRFYLQYSAAPYALRHQAAPA